MDMTKLAIAFILGAFAVWQLTGLAAAKQVFLFSLAGGLTTFAIKFIQHRQTWSKLPGPPHSFFWGHLKVFGEAVMRTGGRSFELALKEFTEYGPDDILFLDLWPIQPCLMIVWDEAADEAILVKDNLPKSKSAYKTLQPVIGKTSMVAVEGEQWKRLRKMFNPAFAPNHLETLIPYIVEESEIFVDKLSEVAERGEIIKMNNLLTYLTIDIIARVIFSIRLHTQKTSNHMVDAFTRLLIDSSEISPTGVLLRAIDPFRYYKRISDENIVDSQMEAYIKDKVASNGAAEKAWKSSSQSDILDLALTDPDYGSEASIPELVDQLKTFFFAGHDTTAATVSWSYYFLSQTPSALACLRRELDDVFGANTLPADVARQLNADPKLHTKLDYTLSVIKESLRLEPPAAPAREAPANYAVCTNTGATIVPPKGTMVYTSAWLLHRNPRVWGEDSNEFKPERFMPGNAVPWGYMPFSKRPRDCIGSTLAYLEAKIILALTARQFDFEPSVKFYRVLKGAQKPCQDGPMRIKVSGYGKQSLPN